MWINWNICTFHTVSGNAKKKKNWCSHSGKQYEVSSKIKNKTTIWFSNPFVSIYPKELKSGSPRDTGTSMLITALFTKSKMWTQPKCPSTDEWIKKMWFYIDIHNGVLFGLKKNKGILRYAKTWMNQEDIMLSERSQSRKENAGWFHLYES